MEHIEGCNDPFAGVASSISSVSSPKAASSRSGSPGSTPTTYQLPTKLSLNVPKSPSNASPQFYTGELVT